MAGGHRLKSGRLVTGLVLLRFPQAVIFEGSSFCQMYSPQCIPHTIGEIKFLNLCKCSLYQFINHSLQKLSLCRRTASLTCWETHLPLYVQASCSLARVPASGMCLPHSSFYSSLHANSVSMCTTGEREAAPVRNTKVLKGEWVHNCVVKEVGL